MNNEHAYFAGLPPPNRSIANLAGATFPLRADYPKRDGRSVSAFFVQRESKLPRKAAGFAIPSAIFLVVVLALLAAFLVRLSTLQSTTSTQDIQSTRAYHAARTGLEWGLFSVLDPAGRTISRIKQPFGSGAAVWPNHPVCPANTNLTIEGFNVFVTCTASAAVTEGQTSGVLNMGAGTGCMLYTDGSGEAAPCALRSIQGYTLTATASMGTAGTPNYVERSISSAVSYCRNKVAATNFVCM